MKNAKKIGIALLLVLLIGALAIFTALANDGLYTGSIYWLEVHVDRYKEISTEDSARAEREAAIEEIDEYLASTPVDPTLPGYADLALVIKNGKIAITNSYLKEIDATNVAAEKKAEALKNAKKWFEITPYTAEDKEGDAYKDIVQKIDSVAIPIAQAMLEAIDADNLGDFQNGYYFKVFSSFMKTTEFDEDTDEYKALKEAYEELKVKYEDAVELVKQSLYADAPLEEYDYGIDYNTGFEAGQPVPTFVKNNSGTNSLGQKVETQLVTEKEELADGSVNNYRTMRFSGVELATYYGISSSDASRGTVFELDITTFGEFPKNGIKFESYSPSGNSTWFKIDGDGKMLYEELDKDGASKTTGEFVGNDKIIVPGEWTHISFIFNPEKPTEGELYIDYCRVCDKNGDPIKITLKGYTPSQLRVGNTYNSKGEFSVDNIKFTIGTAHRDDQYINNLSDDSARFLYYAKYLANENNRVPSLVRAYQSMTELMKNFASVDKAASEDAGKDIYVVLDDYKDNQDIIDAIAIYNGTDEDAITAAYMLENLTYLQGIVDKLTKIARGPATIEERIAKINEANLFIQKNSTYILTGEEFNKCQSDIANAILQHEIDTNVAKFISAMKAFQDANSYIMLESKYREATSYYEAIGVKMAESIINATGYEGFKEMYAVYETASIEVGDALGMKNSKDIVTSVNYLLARYPDEVDWRLVYIEDVNNPGDLDGNGVIGVADVELAVQNNKDYEFIDTYLTIIRNMVNGEYDENYIGVDGAIQRFEPLNTYYYNILQEHHAAHIKEQLDTLAATRSYISKEGIIAYLKRYKESNDVDISHPSIAPLQVRMDAYEGELKDQVDDYAGLLRENTSYFVNVVRMFDTAITYTQKKAYFEEATLYYYEMNATSTEVDVAGAIAKYNLMERELAIVENASAEFIRNMALLPAAETSDDYYRYLIGAMMQYENIDESIDGVAEAKTAYITAYNAYCAKVEATNSEIAETGTALGSLRANCGLSAIISAFIERIFNF